MAEVTKIQWTDHTWNPWIGCTKVAPGCANCYAEADMDKRRGRVKWGPNGTRSRTSDAYWRGPLKWDKEAKAAGERHRVFCASLADVFEDWQGVIVDADNTVIWQCSVCGDRIKTSADASCRVKGCPADYQRLTMHNLRVDLFELIDATPNLDWLLLTKRPENILRVICPNEDPDFDDNGVFQYHRKNLWLGTSISDQATASKAIPELLRCRELASVLFLSAEPLLGPIEFSDVTKRSDAVQQLGKPALSGIDWVIVGGESGPGARPCDVGWIGNIVKQCNAAKVPVFVKQLGANAWLDSITFDDSDPGSRFKTTDKKGGDWDEWPADLRVREFPVVTS